MSGVGDAAAAILGAAPTAPRFPAVGIITRLAVRRGTTGTGPITGITQLTVSVDGIGYECGWSGAFLAEISVASTDPASTGAAFIGRQVKVETLGGQLLVAYTVNRSG